MMYAEKPFHDPENKIESQSIVSKGRLSLLGAYYPHKRKKEKRKKKDLFATNQIRLIFYINNSSWMRMYHQTPLPPVWLLKFLKRKRKRGI